MPSGIWGSSGAAKSWTDESGWRREAQDYAGMFTPLFERMKSKCMKHFNLLRITYTTDESDESFSKYQKSIWCFKFLWKVLYIILKFIVAFFLYNFVNYLNYIYISKTIYKTDD